MSLDGLEEARVLVVDGEETLSDRLGPALGDAGAAVETVASASDCLARVSDGEVDAVVGGYALPDVDGVRLVRSIRVSHPLLPFVLVPESGSESVAGDAVAAGASGYVPTDADVETIVDRLREAVRRVRGRADDESLHRYRHVLELSPAPINVFDETGESIWCNSAVVDLLDLDGRADLLGRSIFEFVHPDDHERARAELEAVTDAKEAAGPTRMKLRTAAGEVRHVHVATAIGTFRGADVGQAVVVDVTDRYERDQQLKALDTWLRHNIRNEVTVIQGMAESIEDGTVADATVAARRIRTHALHLVEQADCERQILSMLSDPPDRVPTDVSAVVERAATECRLAYPAAEVVVDAAAGLVATAVPELEDAVRELIENGIRHADVERPVVRVETARDERGRIAIRIADTGPGIPERERETLLADREITQLNHGTGLGLLFVHWVVRLSDGDVEVSETDGGGSLVTITLRGLDDD